MVLKLDKINKKLRALEKKLELMINDYETLKIPDYKKQITKLTDSRSIWLTPIKTEIAELKEEQKSLFEKSKYWKLEYNQLENKLDSWRNEANNIINKLKEIESDGRAEWKNRIHRLEEVLRDTGHSLIATHEVLNLPMLEEENKFLRKNLKKLDISFTPQIEKVKKKNKPSICKKCSRFLNEYPNCYDTIDCKLKDSDSKKELLSE